MSIIFQLFSAEDLRKLDYSELEDLREAVLKALQDDSSKASKPRTEVSGLTKPPETVQELKQIVQAVFEYPPPQRATRSTNSRESVQNELRALKNRILEVLNTPAEKLYLNLTEKTEIDEESPPNIQNQPGVNEALKNRFHEVYRQLKATSSSPPPTFDYDKLINPAISSQEELILRWAISCELNHIEFYDRLLTAKKAAYAEFTKMMRTGRRSRNAIPGFEEAHIKPPDSRYSPFNPRNPLYRQYVESPRSAPKPPGSYTPTGS
jgi:hypothetical protein